MSDTDTDISRIKGMIFESVSRTDLFEALVGEVDELMRLPPARGITGLSNDFADASQTAGRAAATGYGFTTVWVNRAKEPMDRLPWQPAH